VKMPTELVMRARALAAFFGPDMADSATVADTFTELADALENAQTTVDMDLVHMRKLEGTIASALLWAGDNDLRDAFNPPTVEAFYSIFESETK